MRGVAKTIKTSPAGIAFAAVKRLFNLLPLNQVGLSLVVSVAASLVNLGVALVVRRAGDRYQSFTLQTNSQPLLSY